MSEATELVIKLLFFRRALLGLVPVFVVEEIICAIDEFVEIVTARCDERTARRRQDEGKTNE